MMQIKLQNSGSKKNIITNNSSFLTGCKSNNCPRNFRRNFFWINIRRSKFQPKDMHGWKCYTSSQVLLRGSMICCENEPQAEKKQTLRPMITYEIEFYYYNGLIIRIESPVHALRLTSISGKLLADTSQMWVSHLVPRGSSEIDKPSEK